MHISVDMLGFVVHLYIVVYAHVNMCLFWRLFKFNIDSNASGIDDFFQSFELQWSEFMIWKNRKCVKVTKTTPEWIKEYSNPLTRFRFKMLIMIHENRIMLCQWNVKHKDYYRPEMILQLLTVVIEYLLFILFYFALMEIIKYRIS